MELCFTPTYNSWASPIEAHFGPLREFVLNNSNHPNHVMLTRRLHQHLRWRNKNARAPELLAAQRRERSRGRAEKGRQWGNLPNKTPDELARSFGVRALADKAHPTRWSRLVLKSLRVVVPVFMQRWSCCVQYRMAV